MRLRTRLALAFLLMSVVPLTAITVYSYTSSIRAFRRAVEAEEATIASDMGRRMETVTAAVSDRVDRISTAAQARDWMQRDPSQVDQFRQQVVAEMGDAAGLVSRLQFVPAPPAPPGPPGAPPLPGRRFAHQRDRFSAPPPAATVNGQAGPPAPRPLAADTARAQDRSAQAGAVQNHAAEIQPAIDLIPAGTPIPRNLQALEGINFEQRIEADRQRAEQRHQQWMQRMHEGRAIDIPVHRDGNLVGTMNAQISLDRVLMTVLSGRSRQSGEIAFAIDKDGKLHTPDANDRRKLESLGLLDRVRQSKDRALTLANDDYLLVTRRDPSGMVFGIARPVGSGLSDIRRTTGTNLGLGLLAIMVALVGIAPLSRRMTRNISVLHAGVKQIAQGDLSVRVPVRSADEIGHLSEAFNQMAQDLGAHEKLLAERERLRGELELCRQIQNEMLPKHPLRLPFAEIKGVSIPAREVGGDFFNYFLLPDGEVAVLVGDVSGKGVGAALLMANVQATLRARLPVEPSLAHLVDAIDREIEENTPRSVYLTLFVGILDSTHRRLRYVNAGHNPQFVLRATSGLDRLPSTGLPVGMFAGHGYQEGAIDLNEGDGLFFYTDGITEVENEAGEMFGSERLERILATHPEEGVDALLARIEQDVKEFRGRAEPFDDATMMVLRVGTDMSHALSSGGVLLQPAVVSPEADGGSKTDGHQDHPAEGVVGWDQLE